MERYTTKIEGDHIAVIRQSDRNSISFAFDEVVFGYSVIAGLTTDAKPLINRLRREAVKLAKHQPEWVWG